MDGSVISDAQQVLDNGQVKVSMSMNADGSNIWRKTTGSNIDRSVAIVLDGFGGLLYPLGILLMARR